MQTFKNSITLSYPYQLPIPLVGKSEILTILKAVKFHYFINSASHLL